jgi:hypothetical protein
MTQTQFLQPTTAANLYHRVCSVPLLTLEAAAATLFASQVACLAFVVRTGYKHMLQRAGARAAYNVTTGNPLGGSLRASNPAPYCANLFAPTLDPWVFQHVPLQGKEPGFPFWVDVQLSKDAAAQLVQHGKEAQYLDEDTETVTVELTTYNTHMKLFSQGLVRFIVDAGGQVLTIFRVNVTKVRLPVSVAG